MKLLSDEFLIFAVVAIVLVNVLRGRLRQLAFQACNLYFIRFLVLDGFGTASTLAFCLLGYVLMRLQPKGRTIAFWLATAIITLCFLYMRDYSFLQWIVPAAWRTDMFQTVGLSFILFRTLHVVIEARSGTLGPCTLFDYLNYNLAFTTFLMGPIQRFQDFRDQWHDRRKAIPLTVEAHLDAVNRILLGFVKAYVIGGRMELFLLSNQSPLDEIPYGRLLLGFYIFFPFLYFNFSGYCDIVIGIGSLLGVRPPENFDKPFLSVNVSDFWLRMHRSLTLWLTDYLFSPLYKYGLSNRILGRSPMTTMTGALMITMFVSGIWHGTSLSFVVFGLLHGVFLVVYRFWDLTLIRKLGKPSVRAWRAHWFNRLAGMVITYHAVSLAYLFFDLNISDAMLVIQKLLRI